MVKKNEKKPCACLKKIKILALIALVCSVFLTAFLFYQSSLTASRSSEISDTVKNIIKDIFRVNETVFPQKIEFNEDTIRDGKYYFSGDKIKLPMSFTPAGAGRDVTYTFSSENCTVDAWGYITYNGAESESVTITATSVYDPAVSDTVTVLFRGMAPNDPHIERIDVEFVGDGDAVYSADELKVGMPYTIRTYAVIKDEYLDEYELEDGRASLTLLYDLILNDAEMEDICVFDSVAREVTFVGEYSGQITFRYKNGAESYFDGGFEFSGVNERLDASVYEDEEYEYLPENALIPDMGEYDAQLDMYVVSVPQDILEVEIYSTDQNDGKNYMSKLIYADDASANAGGISFGHIVSRKVNSGECYLYLVSYFDENIKTKIKIIFEGESPSVLELVGQKTVSIYGTAKYSYNTDVRLYGSGAVRWSIVEGEKNADINNGILMARRIGRVVIRVESADDPSLYDEMSVNILLWENFSQFVRKIIGHFTLFALLGICYAVTSYLLLNKKWISALITPIGVFAVASLTELVQYYTEGRFGSWYDVFFNFLGGLTGIALICIISLIFAVVLKIIRPASYKDLKGSLGSICFAEIFKKK